MSKRKKKSRIQPGVYGGAKNDAALLFLARLWRRIGFMLTPELLGAPNLKVLPTFTTEELRCMRWLLSKAVNAEDARVELFEYVTGPERRKVEKEEKWQAVATVVGVAKRRRHDIKDQGELFKSVATFLAGVRAKPRTIGGAWRAYEPFVSVRIDDAASEIEEESWLQNALATLARFGVSAEDAAALRRWLTRQPLPQAERIRQWEQLKGITLANSTRAQLLQQVADATGLNVFQVRQYIRAR